jgi:hypothetical protein
MTEEHRKARDRYLQKYIFNDLENLNDGFDVLSISYFNEAQFAVILERIKATNAVGLYGLEPHFLNPETGQVEYFAVETYESYSTFPQDSNWYLTAFEKFKATGVTLYYSASYHVPGNYLIFEE